MPSSLNIAKAKSAILLEGEQLVCMWSEQSTYNTDASKDNMGIGQQLEATFTTILSCLWAYGWLCLAQLHCQTVWEWASEPGNERPS